jgi:hypothetical protein
MLVIGVLYLIHQKLFLHKLLEQHQIVPKSFERTFLFLFLRKKELFKGK